MRMDIRLMEKFGHGTRGQERGMCFRNMYMETITV